MLNFTCTLKEHELALKAKGRAQGPWALGPWAQGPGAWGPGARARGPWAQGPMGSWAMGPRACSIKKMMKMDPIRVAMPPHGLIFGGIEPYRLQEAFGSIPGAPGLRKRTTNDKKGNKNQIFPWILT